MKEKEINSHPLAPLQDFQFIYKLEVAVPAFFFLKRKSITSVTRKLLNYNSCFFFEHELVWLFVQIRETSGGEGEREIKKVGKIKFTYFPAH